MYAGLADGRVVAIKDGQIVKEHRIQKVDPELCKGIMRSQYSLPSSSLARFEMNTYYFMLPQDHWTARKDVDV